MAHETDQAAQAAHITAWECIGCGRIEGGGTCIGICEDRKTEFVHAADYEKETGRLEGRVHALEAFARRLARITPRKGEWEHTYRALQDEARRILQRTA